MYMLICSPTLKVLWNQSPPCLWNLDGSVGREWASGENDRTGRCWQTHPRRKTRKGAIHKWRQLNGFNITSTLPLSVPNSRNLPSVGYFGLPLLTSSMHGPMEGVHPSVHSGLMTRNREGEREVLFAAHQDGKSSAKWAEILMLHFNLISTAGYIFDQKQWGGYLHR